MKETPVSLLERLRLGEDEESWKLWVKLYGDLLHGWLRRCLLQAADADDIVQEVFAVTFRRIKDFRHSGQTGAFRHWLRTILVHCTRDFWRKRDRQPATTDPEAWRRLEELEDETSDLSRSWEREHNQHVSRYFLQQIDEHFEAATCRAFRAVALEGKSAQEAADAVGISANAVRLAKSRVLHWLRKVSEGLLDSGALQ